MEIGNDEVISTGVPGLDYILRGGFTPGYMYFIQGEPGTGKTTLAFQFLLEGVRQREPCLYVGPSGGNKELQRIARSHGWHLDQQFFHTHEIDITLDIETAKLRIYHPSETELFEAIKCMYERVNEVQPRRVIVDCLPELRFLAQDALTYRRSILDMKMRLTQQERTVLIVESGTATEDTQVEAIVHGVILLERAAHGFGPVRRQLQVTKYRGKMFRGGWHDIEIEEGGVKVFPTIIATEHGKRHETKRISSGNRDLDGMLGGGIIRGTNVAIMGPSGAGKSTLSTLFAVTAAKRREKAIIYTFEETEQSFLERSEGMGLKLDELIRQGTVQLVQVNVAQMSPGEFVYGVMNQVDNGEISMIVIDSINGYIASMPDERYLVIHLHEFLMSLSQKGVTTILTVSQHGVLSAEMKDPLDMTYLADGVLLLRYFERNGEVRRAVSVVKQRSGYHESTIRELSFRDGIKLSEPLRDMQGVLTGVPIFSGTGK